MAVQASASNAVRWLRPVGVLLAGAVGALVTAGPPWGAAEAGLYSVMRLPAGVTDLILSEDGGRAVAASVVYDLKRSTPKRVVTAMDVRAGRIVWQRTLPAVSCCSFPVFSATRDVEWVAVGGAQDVVLFTFAGQPAGRIGRRSGLALNNVVRMDGDGSWAVAGQADGQLVGFTVRGGRVHWRAHAGGELVDLALGNHGDLAAVTLEEVVVLSGTPPAPRYRMKVGPAPAAAAAGLPGGFVVAWRGTDDRLRLGFVEEGRWRWRRLLGGATVPVLQVDAWGRWIAVSDFLGDGAWLVSRDGEVVWRGVRRPTTAAMGRDGRVVLITGDQMEVRSPGSRQMLWRARLPGRAHAVRLGGPVLAVLGSKDVAAVLPDHLWLFRVEP
ncbi:hypothetical protein HRbin32_01393 [bacterium HR32]|nr:hypothetical protein HRbin32_01393 [bacterium HR32]